MAFRQTVPKVLSIADIFKSSFMIYLRKHIGIQCPAGSKVSVSVCIDFKLISLPYLPKVNPPVPPSYQKCHH